MVVESVQSYLDMVGSLRRASRARALATARLLLGQAGLGDAADEAGERVTKLADELQQARRANRDLVQKLVATEVDKAASRWGFVRTDDLEALRDEVAELRRSLVRATVDLGEAAAPESPSERRGTARPAPSTAPAAQQPPLGGAPDAPGFSDEAEPPLADETPASPIPAPVRSGPAKKAARAKSSGDQSASTPAKKAARKTATRKATTSAPVSAEAFETTLPTPAPPVSVPPPTPAGAVDTDAAPAPGTDAEAVE